MCLSIVVATQSMAATLSTAMLSEPRSVECEGTVQVTLPWNGNSRLLAL